MAETQVLDAYPLAPGCDYFTKGTRTPCVDTGYEIDRFSAHGRVYISEDTVGEWARLFGWIPPHEFEELKDSLVSARRKILELAEQVHALEKFRDALQAAESVLGDGSGTDTPEEAANAGDGDSAAPEAPLEYPHHKGAGWWVLSDGRTIRGDRGVAEAEEAKLRSQETAA